MYSLSSILRFEFFFVVSLCYNDCKYSFGFVGIFRDKSRNSARIMCRVCSEEYQTEINFLSEPIDVYNCWVDACETAN